MVTKAEELARVIRWHIASRVERDVRADCLSAFELDELARAILASPVIERIERDAEMRVVEWLRADTDLTEIEAAKIVKNTTGNARQNAAEWAMLVRLKRGLARAIEAGEHKEKAGG